MAEQPYEVSEAVRQAAASGRKIDAIKILRRETGLGLKEAKHIVDALGPVQGSGPADAAPMMQEEGGGKGFIKMIVAIIVLVIAYSVFFGD